MNEQTQISIRTTEDERVSVIDIIKLISGETNPLKTWQKICEDHPNIVDQCENYNFSEDQSEPVAGRQIALTIIDLLPDDFKINHWESVVQYLKTQI